MLICTGAFSGQAEWRRLSHAIQSQVRIAPDSSSIDANKILVKHKNMCFNEAMNYTPKQLVRYFGTQKKAAQELGYTQQNVSLWVKRDKLPRHVQKHFASYRMAWRKYGG